MKVEALFVEEEGKDESVSGPGLLCINACKSLLLLFYICWYVRTQLIGCCFADYGASHPSLLWSATRHGVALPC